jgi:TATA element modulatory factor
VYALTKERDTLRREQNKKSDAAALLKEKDEIINQVMAEGIQNLCIMPVLLCSW